MDLERWRNIETLYDSVAERSPADRAALLAKADPDIRGEVEVLLAQPSRGALLDEPVASFLGESSSASLKMEGRCLSGYQIVREIGHGGMGAVYLAERVDGVIHKQVAIKLMQTGMGDASLLDRFHREREILASLDHPAIARLMDGGSTEEGLPYFVMEYVEGQPIDGWCDQHKLNITERVKLFREVCAAVQYAHRHLVVHRDLKPGNILVTVDGTVKLLDFGIAKVIDPPSTFLAATVTLLQPMTVEYASPEQVRGEAITTLTDVYSLGVVLYELLTGHRPYPVTNRSPYEVARLICEQDPVQPSGLDPAAEDQPAAREDVAAQVREGSAGKLKRRLEGDLDHILLMALRKEPPCRYSSVEQFSEDLRRHLEELPVIARKHTLRYRAGKLARRHPGLIALAVLMFLAIVAGALVTSWEARIILQERHEQNRLLGWTLPTPLWVWYYFETLAVLGTTIYMTRANATRIAGALAGSGVWAVLYWPWRLAFPDTWRSMSISGVPSALVFLVAAGTLLLLIAWRVARRYGWRGRAVFIIVMPIFLTIRGYGFSKFFDPTTSSGIKRLTGDALFLVVSLALGELAMFYVAGPVRSDPLARSR